MTFSSSKNLTLLLLTALVVGCTAQPQVHKYETPPVQVQQTCPVPPPLPAELRQPMEPDFIQRIERLLTDYYRSVGKPTPPSASGTSR